MDSGNPPFRGRGRQRGDSEEPGRPSKMSRLEDDNGNGGGGPRQRGGMNRRARITILEEDYLQSQMPKMTDRFGVKGQKVQVYTNFARFNRLPNSGTIFLYDSNFDPKITAKTVIDRYNLLKGLQKAGKLDKVALAYDGRMIYTHNALGAEDLISVHIEDPKLVAGSGGGARISFRKVAEFPPGSEQYFKTINVIINLAQQLLGQKKFGSDFFVPASTDLRNTQYSDINAESYRPGRLKLKDQYEVLQGYRASLQRALCDGQTMPIMHVSSIHRLASIDTSFDMISRNARLATTTLPGRTVITRYNNKAYVIADVLSQMCIDKTFGVGEKQISYREYFSQRYGIRLNQTNQPFLKLKLKRVDRLKRLRILKQRGDNEDSIQADLAEDILVPAEICFLTGFSEEEKSRFQRDRDFNTICRKAPEKRAEDVARFVRFISSSQATNNLLKEWSIDIRPEPLRVNARVMDSCFDSRQRFRDTASINNNSVRPIKPRERNDTRLSVGVMCLSRNRPDSFRDYTKALQDIARKMGFDIHFPNNAFINARAINDGLLEGKQKQFDIVLCFVDDTTRYKEIKTTSIEHGVLTQVVRSQTSQKKMTAQKVALQMAVKCGFAGWRLADGLPNGNVDFMIVGVDTFMGKGLNAVQAAVFSLDGDCSQYYTHVTYAQGRNMDLQSNLNAGFKEALRVYGRRNGKLPTRIFVYRDGVSDSQLGVLKDMEVTPLVSVLDEEYRGHAYHLVFTVVKKRINQRFFLCDHGRFGNVRPGTVIDNTIIKPNWFEYYIVPQDAAQGTATPTNFNVYFNNATKPGDRYYMPPDDLQRTTFALTHLYFNWTGTIRVPAPVQYAHKCAFLLGQCAINCNINQAIRSNLFYL